MQQASRISDKTAFFLTGEVIEYGATQQIFNNPVEKKQRNTLPAGLADGGGKHDKTGISG